MGLCKCPKRKTTSHFCFHHCVNVCEHCIVNNHVTCVVKSYTTWLKEASGSSSSSSVSASAPCAFCQKQFAYSSPKEVESLSSSYSESGSNKKSAIRLLCYHVIHAHCLSVYTKKLLKEGNILKCPSCARPLWLQNDTNGTKEVDSNELSPVALQLYKYLHDKWWGQALITNRNIEDIEKHLFEDNSEDTVTDLFVDQSIVESKPLMNVTSSHNSLQTSDHQTQLTNGYNSPELVHSISNATFINHRSNSHQTFQRNFNNNYGRDLFIPQQQQECSSINVMSITSNSDLSNRYTTAITPLLSNNNSNLNLDEKQDPSEKYRPKKFYNQSWSLSFQRLFQYFTGSNNKTEEHSTKKIAILVILCICIIVILLVVITSYTRSINEPIEPFDMNSIDYGGQDEDKNNNAAVHVKSYDINNL